MICGSGGSKSRLAKAAGAEPAGQTRDEKLHAVVARSTFPSQNVQNTPRSDHFWQLRCWKSARRCGTKHISKSKCTKHTIVGPLLEVEMSKKCTPLWREACFEVKMLKTHNVRTTFGSCDVEKVHAVVARSTFGSQNVKNTRGSDHFWRFRCRKSARRCGAKHILKSNLKTPGVRTTFGTWDVEKVHAAVARSTFPSQNVKNTRGTDFWSFRCRFASLHYTTLHYTTLHYATLHYTTLHSTTLQLQLHNYTTTLHYTTTTTTTTQLHSTTLHYTTLHYTTLHYTTLHSTTLQLQLHNYTPLHSTTLNYTTVHYTTLHSTTLHYTTLHYTTLHYTEWHCTTDRQVDR